MPRRTPAAFFQNMISVIKYPAGLRAAVCFLSAVAFAGSASAQLDTQREWTDATGRFKIVGKFVEVQSGVVLIKTADGKTARIPLEKLSKGDQQLLSGADNPFSISDDGGSPKMPANAPAPGSAAAPTPQSGDGAGGTEFDWTNSPSVDWDAVELFSSAAGADWKVTLPENGVLDFEPKRAPLAKKSNFHEGMHDVVINPLVKRGVCGFTLSFAVPKPSSRITLMDLVSGKSIHSDPVECDMRPLALLNNGSAVVMVGSGDGRSAFEHADQLQIWRLNGKKIQRSGIWIPYPMEKEDWGKKMNASVTVAEVIRDGSLVTISDKGHLVAWKMPSRQPVWHARLTDNCALAFNTDRSLMAILDGSVITVMKPENAEVLGTVSLPEHTHVGWPRLAFSPSGRKLLLTNMGSVMVIDMQKGEWAENFELPWAPIAPNAMSFPDEDYVLLDNRTLLHIPTRIKVCEYADAGRMKTIGGTSFIGFHADSGGMVVPGKFPHPTAAKALEQAKDDPNTFVLRKGSAVSIDTSGAGQWAAEAKQGLENAAREAGFEVRAGAEVTLTASVTGPKQEAVNYIAAGSYVVNTYHSKVALVYKGKDLWSTGGTNIPGMLMTGRNETMEQALAKAGEKPNLTVFSSAKLPKQMQRPVDAAGNQNGLPALMSSRFTAQGLVDSK